MKREIGFPTLVALALVPVVAIMVWSRGGFDFLRTRPCDATTGEVVCLTVIHDHLTVNEVVGSFSLSEPPLAGNTWRLVLTVGDQEYPGLTRDPGSPVAVEYASSGSFPGFSVPNSLTSATELCIAAQVRTAGTWTTVTTPARACSSVS